MKPNFPLKELRQILSDTKCGSDCVRLSAHINNRISARDKPNLCLEPSFIYLAIPLFGIEAGLEIHFAVRLEQENQTEPTYYPFTEILALKTVLEMLPKGAKKVKIPEDFPLEGLTQLLEKAGLKPDDQADAVCLKLKQALTVLGDEGEVTFIADASLSPDEENVIRLLYAGNDPRVSAFDIAVDELRQLATTDRSNASDNRPTHG